MNTTAKVFVNFLLFALFLTAFIMKSVGIALILLIAACTFFVFTAQI